MKSFKIFFLFIIFIFFTSIYSQNIPKNIPSEKKIEKTDEFKKKETKNEVGKEGTKDETKEKVVEKKEDEKKQEDKKESDQKKFEKLEKENKKDNINEDSKKTLDKDYQDYNYNIQPKIIKNYTEKGVIEIGGITWFESKALRSGTINKIIWTNDFIYFFITDYFLMGTRVDYTYNLDTERYKFTGYFVIGGGFPISNTLFVLLSLNTGYSKNNYETSKSLFSYGNELSLKIKLKDNFLMGLGVIYNFYTDFSQNFFNDKLNFMLSFSGYF